MNDDKQDALLPPRPGEKPAKKEIKGTPFVIYLNGAPIEISKKEALGVMAQIVNIMMYLDELSEQGEG
jgi:hypothetical protein